MNKEKFNSIGCDIAVLLILSWTLLWRSCDDRKIMNNISQEVQQLKQNINTLDSTYLNHVK